MTNVDLYFDFATSVPLPNAPFIPFSEYKWPYQPPLFDVNNAYYVGATGEQWRYGVSGASLTGLVNAGVLTPYGTAPASYTTYSTTLATVISSGSNGLMSAIADSSGYAFVCAHQRPSSTVRAIIGGTDNVSGGHSLYWENTNTMDEVTRGGSAMGALSIPASVIPGAWCVVGITQRSDGRDVVVIGPDGASVTNSSSFGAGAPGSLDWSIGYINAGLASTYRNPLTYADTAIWKTGLTTAQIVQAAGESYGRLKFLGLI